MFRMDLGSGDSGGYVVVALRGELASVAEAAASAVASRLVAVPIPRQPTRMRWQRIAMNPPAPRRRAVTGDWLSRGLWAPRGRPAAVGGISG
jgi:hypothetical protein